jgi:hypothetical protein
MSLSDSNFLIKISRRLGKSLGRSMTDTDNLQIMKMVRKTPLTVFTVNYDEIIINKLIKLFSNKNQSTKTDQSTTDIHEYLNATIHKDYTEDLSIVNNEFIQSTDPSLKKYINHNIKFSTKDDKSDKDSRLISNTRKGVDLNSVFGVRDLHYFQRIINPKAQYKYVHVLLDTDNASAVDSSGNKFTWNYMSNTQLSSGTVNAIGASKDLVGMRLYPITTQVISTLGHSYTTALDTRVVVTSGTGVFDTFTNDYTDLNHNFTLLIEEFSAQAFVGREGRKYHFVMFPYLMNKTNTKPYGTTTPADPYYEFVTSGKGNGTFWFRTPITTFNTLTISMGNPFELFSLSKTTRTLIPIELIFLNDVDSD